MAETFSYWNWVVKYPINLGYLVWRHFSQPPSTWSWKITKRAHWPKVERDDWAKERKARELVIPTHPKALYVRVNSWEIGESGKSSRSSNGSSLVLGYCFCLTASRLNFDWFPSIKKGNGSILSQGFHF